MIAQIISQTPTWVFGMFAGLLALGLMQTRHREVRQWMAYLLPAGLIGLSFYGVQSSFGVNLLPVGAWLAGV